jgi:archaeosine-15-forming tRNA-guanine transglycosylase
MENFRKKESNRNTKHSGRPLQQTRTVGNRLSELKDRIEIKEKTEELLVKQLKTCERNMQELNDSTKRPNLRIMGIEEGEEVQAKGIHNIFNKMITENFPKLKKVLPIQDTKQT